MIVTTAKTINKNGVQAFGKATPAADGFFNVGGGALMHFPDEKTLVILHPDLKQKYLDGYAKNRSGWPMTADLNRAAAGHTLYAAVNLDKVPRKMLQAPKSSSSRVHYRSERSVSQPT